MLPETSNVSMIVPSTRGSATVACGPGHRDREQDEGGDDEDRGHLVGGRPAGEAGPGRSGATAGAARAQPADPAERRQLPPPAPSSIRRAARHEERDEPDREQHERPDEGHAGFRLRSRRSIAIRTIARTRSSSVESVTASTPARRNDAAIRASRASAAARNRAPEPRVAGVDVELLAGLRVVHQDRPDVRQVDLAGVDETDREELVAAVEQLQRALPAGDADEVRDEDHERAPLDPAVGGLEERAEIRERRARETRLAEQVLDQPEHLDPARSRPG